MQRGRKTTWGEVRTWNKNGVEIWSHGTNHDNYTIKGFGFTLPGVAPEKGQGPLYNGLAKPSDYISPTGKLLMETYAITEAYYKNTTLGPVKKLAI
mgnify:CR=1 FL=1